MRMDMFEDPDVALVGQLNHQNQQTLHRQHNHKSQVVKGMMKFHSLVQSLMNPHINHPNHLLPHLLNPRLGLDHEGMDHDHYIWISLYDMAMGIDLNLDPDPETQTLSLDLEQ